MSAIEPIKSRVIVKYADLSAELWDFLTTQGAILLWVTQIKRIIVGIDEATADAVLTAIRAHADVESADFDRPAQIDLRATTPDDLQTIFGNDRICKAIRAYEAWDIQKGRPDVVLPFTDTGVDETHPDLNAAVVLTDWTPIATDGRIANSGATSITRGPYPHMLDLYALMGGANQSKDVVVYQNITEVPYTKKVKAVIYLNAACTVVAPNPVVPSQHRYVYYTHPITYAILEYGTLGTNEEARTLTVPFIDENTRVKDFDGHGNMTTSVAVAQHNGVGINGIAPGCKTVMFPMADYWSWYSVASCAVAICNAADVPGAAAVNCSWGGGTFFQELSDAFAYVNNKVGADGTQPIVVSASGNYSLDMSYKDAASYPGLYAGSIDVGGTGSLDGFDAKAFFATRADSVFICAPAADYMVAATTTPIDFENSQRRDWGQAWKWGALFSEYHWARLGLGGTSFAAPVISATIGLMVSEAKDRGTAPLSRAQIRQYLKDSANPDLYSNDGTVKYDTTTPGPLGNPVDGMGWGLVDIRRALQAVRGEIDVRIKRVNNAPAAGVSAPVVDIDVRTWGGGIANIKVYVNDVLYETLTPGGTSYRAVRPVTFAAAGSEKVHVVATDSNGSVYTSTPLYVEVAAEHAPLLDAVVYPDRTRRPHEYQVLSAYTVEEAQRPVAVYPDGILKFTVGRTYGATFSATNLKVYIDGALFGDFNGTWAPGTASVTLANPTSLTPGYHTMRLDLTGGGKVVSKTYDMVYTGSVLGIYAKPWTYQNGILEFEVFCTIAPTQFFPAWDFENTTSLSDFTVKIDGEYFAADYWLGLSLDTHRRFRFQIPRPTSVEVEIVAGQGTYYRVPNPDEGYERQITDPFTTASAVLTPAVDLGPSVDLNPPKTFMDKCTGQYAPGSTITFGEWNDKPDTTVKYRWLP